METQEKFLWGAVLGTALGAAAALLFTPYSGGSLRRGLSHGFNASGPTSKRRPSTRYRAEASSKTDQEDDQEKQASQKGHSAYSRGHSTRSISTSAPKRSSAKAVRKSEPHH